MKKKGSALATVLIIFSALLILGTAVSSAVVNTKKFNAKYSDNIDLELAAKSALNIAVEDFVKSAGTKDDVNSYSVDESQNYINVIYNISSGIRVDIDLIKAESKVIINSQAFDRESSSKSKNQSKVFNISYNENLKPPVTPEGGGLVFNNLFNIGNNITSLGDSQQQAISQFEYGGNCVDLTANNGHGTQKPSKNEDLNKMNINLNIDAINDLKKLYDVSNKVYHDRNKIEVENSRVVYEKLDGDNLSIDISNSNILFNQGGSSGNDTRIKKLESSEMIINGNSWFSKLNIENMNNSKLIINGNLEIQNEFSLNSSNTENGKNLILINGDFNIGGNGPNINLNDSIIVIVGNLKVQNQLKLTMKNSAIICIKNNVNQVAGISTGNFDFGTNPQIINTNGSYLYCEGDFRVGNVMNIISYGDNIPQTSFVNEMINKFLTITSN